MLVVMVSESSPCRPLKLKFIFQGDQVDNNNNIINMKVPLNARTTGLPIREVRVKEEQIGSFEIARATHYFDHFLTIQLLKGNKVENR